MQIIIRNYRCASWNELNRSIHWRARANFRDELYILTNKALRESLKGKKVERFDGSVDMRIEAHFKGSNRRDPDNLYVKPIQDALVFRGVLKDDSGKYVASLTLSVKTKMQEDQVIVTIEPRNL